MTVFAVIYAAELIAAHTISLPSSAKSECPDISKPQIISSDFKNVKVNLVNYEELRESINKGKYLKGKLIVYLSRPLIIDKNNAFISFDIGNGDMGFYPITHFTISMKKENDKWIQSEFYEDGVF